MNTIQILRRFSFNEWGGSETVTWNIARCLKSKDNHVEIAATSAFDCVGRRDVNDIPIHRFKYFYPLLGLSKDNRLTLDRKGGNPFVIGLYRYLVASDAELLHCHCMQRIANTARLAAEHKKIPYVVSFQGGYAELPNPELLDMNRPMKFRLNYGGIIDYFTKEQLYLERADGIVCVDYHEYQAVRTRFPRHLVEYLPNGVDVERFSTRPGVDFKSFFAIPPDRYLILCVSRIDFSKNQQILLEMLRQLLNNHENPHLVLIGSVSSELYYDQLLSDVAEFNLEDRVTISRGLRFDDPLLEAAYQSADCFILPSIQEPFGIVVLEAWAAGTPVICSNVGGLQRLVTDGQTGLFFNDFSVEDLLQKFYRLKNDDELRQNMVTKAGKEVRLRYSWETITQHLTDFYRRVSDHYRYRHQ